MTSGALVAQQPTRRNIALWFIATVYGTFGAYARAYLGLWHFANPTWAGVPVWVVWVWGIAVLSLAQLAEWLHTILTPVLARRMIWHRVVYGIGILSAIGYGVVVFQTLHRVFGWLEVGMVLIVLTCRPNGRHLILFWLAAVAGLIGESTSIGAGIHAYAIPLSARWDIPIALQVSWGLSAVFVYALSEAGWGRRAAA